MKFRIKRGDITLEYERPPMRAARFRALCLLAAIGLYAGMVCTVANLCGLYGLVAVGAVTLVCVIVSHSSD